MFFPTADAKFTFINMSRPCDSRALFYFLDMAIYFSTFHIYAHQLYSKVDLKFEPLFLERGLYQTQSMLMVYNQP